MTVTLHPQLARVLSRIPAGDLLELTLAAHRAQCRSCGPNGLELCPVGQHLEAAAQPDRAWIPDPNGA